MCVVVCLDLLPTQILWATCSFSDGMYTFFIFILKKENEKLLRYIIIEEDIKKIKSSSVIKFVCKIQFGICIYILNGYIFCGRKHSSAQCKSLLTQVIKNWCPMFGRILWLYVPPHFDVRHLSLPRWEDDYFRLCSR